MKRKFLLSLCLIFCAVFVAAAAMVLSAGPADGGKVTVLNPAVTEKLAERVPLAPRLKGGLQGKTVYLVDMNYEGIGGTPVMREMQKWFSKNMPGVKAEYRLKKGNYVSDDPELWKEISEKGGNAVIMGVAG
jgi:hypothetical protein